MTQIRVEMARRGTTGHDMARRLGYSAQSGYINKIARGAMSVNVRTALMIASLLGRPVLELFVKDGDHWRAAPAQDANGLHRAQEP